MLPMMRDATVVFASRPPPRLFGTSRHGGFCLARGCRCPLALLCRTDPSGVLVTLAEAQARQELERMSREFADRMAGVREEVAREMETARRDSLRAAEEAQENAVAPLRAQVRGCCDAMTWVVQLGHAMPGVSCRVSNRPLSTPAGAQRAAAAGERARAVRARRGCQGGRVRGAEAAPGGLREGGRRRASPRREAPAGALAGGAGRGPAQARAEPTWTLAGLLGSVPKNEVVTRTQSDLIPDVTCMPCPLCLLFLSSPVTVRFNLVQAPPPRRTAAVVPSTPQHLRPCHGLRAGRRRQRW